MRRCLAIWALLLCAIVFGPSPRAQLSMSGVGGGFGPAAGGAATLDPANKSSHTVLSGGNLIATGDGSAGLNDNVRSVTSHSSGKYYFEVTIGTAAVNVGIGIVNGSFTIGSNYVGETNNGIANFAISGTILINGGPAAGSPGVDAASVGDTICVAVDIDNATIWWRVNGGRWNQNGTYDPATNTGGASFSPLGAGAIYAAVEIRDASNAMTAKFSASFAQAIPSGFSAWQ